MHGQLLRRRWHSWTLASALVLSVLRAAAGDVPLIDAVKAGDLGCSARAAWAQAST